MMPLGKRANANYGYSGIYVETEHKKMNGVAIKYLHRGILRTEWEYQKLIVYSKFGFILNIIYQRLKIFKIFLLYLILFGYLNFGNGILQIE